MFRIIEIALFEQVHIREFDSPEWEFKFNSPDFLNAVERATVHMRYRQMRGISINEIREDNNMVKIDDERADDPLWDGKEPEQADIPEPQGSPPEGREPEPDDPSETGEPTDDDQDPERGDQHDEEPRNQMLSELRTWKNFTLKRVKDGKSVRRFNTDYIPNEIASVIHTGISNDYEAVSSLFDTAIREIENIGA